MPVKKKVEEKEEELQARVDRLVRQKEEEEAARRRIQLAENPYLLIYEAYEPFLDDYLASLLVDWEKVPEDIKVMAREEIRKFLRFLPIEVIPIYKVQDDGNNYLSVRNNYFEFLNTQIQLRSRMQPAQAVAKAVQSRYAIQKGIHRPQR